MNLIKLQVKTDSQRYPIIIGNNVINKITKILKENSINFNQCLIVIDSKVPKKLINKILKLLPKNKITIYFFTASEANKNQNLNQKMNVFANQNNLPAANAMNDLDRSRSGYVEEYVTEDHKRNERQSKLLLPLN